MRIGTYGFMVAAGLAAAVAVAAPAGKNAAEPVAAGYPAWTGITPKNYVYGRQLVGGADLRQRVAIVVEFDASKAAEQLEDIGSITRFMSFHPTVDGISWETFVVPHGPIVLYVARNFTTAEDLKEAMKVKDVEKQPGLACFSRERPSIYRDVTFSGAPDAAGQYPYVYVMGSEGTESLYKGKFDKSTHKNIREAIAKDNKKLETDSLTWKPYYGYVSEPKHFGKDIEKALKTGKPTMEVVEAKLLKGVTSSDAETAKEAQMLYDALEQMKSELLYTALLCYRAAPHVAAYKANLVTRQWPKTKKMLDSVQKALKANGNASALIKIYPQLMKWADPEFTCKNAGEAKKIVAELGKMKKMIAPLKESSKDIAAQNGALLLDGMLDELISIIPAKVPQK